MHNNETSIPAWVKTLSDEELELALKRARKLLGKTSHNPGKLKSGLLGTAGVIAGLAMLGSQANADIPDIDINAPSFPGINMGTQKDNNPNKIVASPNVQSPGSNAEIIRTPGAIPKKNEASSLEAWSPKENSPYDDNGRLRVFPNQHLPGVINLLEKNDKTGEWVHYNNIVPVVKVGNDFRNAETEKATAIRTVITNPDGTKFARYQYPKLANGAHIYLDVLMEPGKKEVSIRLGINNDSAKIDAIALGNFLGIAKEIQYIKFGNTTLNANSYPDPQDGHFKPGTFMDFALNQSNNVEFWGKDGTRQYQRIKGAEGQYNYLEGELRRRAWASHMDGDAARIGGNWWEAVQIFTGLPSTGITWTYGIEETPLH